MKSGRIASIVIAAGYSSRMGSFKPFLEFGTYTAVETVINTHRNAGIEDIILVVGHRGTEIIEHFKNSGVVCVMNENYSQGMYSSVVKGVKALDDDVEAFFMQPVDIPLVKKHTLELLKNKYLECDKGIIYPTFIGERGHPPLIDSKYRHAIGNSDGERGLKRLLESFSDDDSCVPVCDEAILMDMDTQEDFENLLRYFHRSAPSRKECYAILNHYNVPDHIVKHCIKVARISMDILYNLKDAAYELDGAALEAAALLHDMARREKNHAQVGTMILKNMGYEHVGHIISTHTDIDVDENKKITENEILYLADKLVKEDQFMLLEERLQQYLKAYRDDLEALRKIKKRYDAAEKIMKKIEKISGKGIMYG
ncbi:MAG: DVU_1551 family NTP transferase [Bacillota bacterium]